MAMLTNSVGGLSTDVLQTLPTDGLAFSVSTFPTNFDGVLSYFDGKSSPLSAAICCFLAFC